MTPQTPRPLVDNREQLSADSPHGSAARRLLWLGGLLLISVSSVEGISLIQHFLGTSMTESVDQHTLRIMSWNIGKLYLQWDSRASDSDLNHVASVIRKVNPHVVALQELRDPSQLGRLVAALGPGWRGKVPEDRYDRRAGLVVRLPAQFFGLPTSTGRIAQAAVVKLPEGKNLTVTSLHLDAFDPRRRLLQAEEILSGAQRLGEKDIFLAGDFNFDPAITAQGGADHELYLFLTRELSDSGKEAGPTTVISRRLDYIFYRSERVWRTDARVLRDRRIHVMDHDPLVAEFSFSEK